MIPKQQCMQCGNLRSVEDLHTQVSYPDTKNRAKKHVVVVCIHCRDDAKRLNPATSPPSRS